MALKYHDPEDWKAVAAMGWDDPGDFPGERKLPGRRPGDSPYVDPTLTWSMGLDRKPEPTRKQQVDEILASHGVRPRKRRSLSDPAPTSAHMPPPVTRAVAPQTIRRTLGYVKDVR
jgi:hypothetical protein